MGADDKGTATAVHTKSVGTVTLFPGLYPTYASGENEQVVSRKNHHWKLRTLSRSTPSLSGHSIIEGHVTVFESHRKSLL